MILGSLDEEADDITQVNDVTLYGTNENLYIGSKKTRVPWGEHHNKAEGYRSICEMNDDIERLASIGFLFEISWSVCSYWLWKNTNDTIFSDRTLEELAEVNYSEDYDLAEEWGEEVVYDIYDYIEDNTEVQSNIINARNRRLEHGETGIITSVRRLNPEDLTGTYKIDGVLFDSRCEQKFKDRSEDYEWLDDADEYILDKFTKAENRNDNCVVSSDGTPKPVVRSVSHILSLDKRYSQELSKLVEVAPQRDDVQVEYQADYEANELHVTVET